MKKILIALVMIKISLLFLFFALTAIVNIFGVDQFHEFDIIKLAQDNIEFDGINCKFTGISQGTFHADHSKCLSWAFPHKRGFYCGYIKEIFKQRGNCMEIIFRSSAPDSVLDKYVKIFQEPCKYYYKSRGNRTHQPRVLECHHGEDHREYTIYVLRLEENISKDQFFIDINDKNTSIITIVRSNSLWP